MNTYFVMLAVLFNERDRLRAGVEGAVSLLESDGRGADAPVVRDHLRRLQAQVGRRFGDLPRDAAGRGGERK